MRPLRLVLARLRALVRRDAVAGEIREEMQFHLDQRAEEYQRTGLKPDQAARAAARRFGNFTLMQERGYDVRGGGVIETILQDVRYGVRLLARHPGFSLVAVLTLGLGVGLCATLFSVIDAVVLRPMPYPAPEEMVSIVIENGPEEDRHRASPSAGDIRRWRQLGRIFAHVGAGQFGQPLDDSVAETPEPHPVLVGEASEDFLEVYGVTPRIGRPFTLDDLRRGAPAVVLLGHAYWMNQLGADAHVVGRTIRLNQTPVTVIGILPEGFYDRLAIWRPAQTAVTRPDSRIRGTVHGRLRPGVSPAQAARELTEFTRQADAARGETFDGRVVVLPLLGGLADSQRTIIGLLAGAVGFVLLIACVNVAGLLLARGTMREPELAVRTSLGASRPRMIRQLLTESLVLSVAGTIAGVAFAWWSLDTLVSLVPLSLPPNSPAEMNLAVLGAATTLALLLPLVFGLWPAFRLSRVRFGKAIARASHRHGPALSRRGGQWLTVVEIALAVTLLAGAGLMVRSFHRLISVDLGFDPESFVTMQVRPVDPSTAARAAYYPELLRAVRQLPGVAAAGSIDVMPLAETYVRFTTSAGGRPLTLSHPLPGYFEALGLRPIAGRFPSDDDWQARRDVAVLNEAMARELFLAVGQSLSIQGVHYQVLGVAPDARRSPLVAAEPRVFLPFGRPPLGNRLAQTLVVRPNGEVALAALALLWYLRSSAPERPDLY